jgi:hypothetical protein
MQRSLAGDITSPHSALRRQPSSGYRRRTPRPPTSRMARSVTVNPTSAEKYFDWLTARTVAARSPRWHRAPPDPPQSLLILFELS